MNILRTYEDRYAYSLVYVYHVHGMLCSRTAKETCVYQVYYYLLSQDSQDALENMYQRHGTRYMRTAITSHQVFVYLSL